MPINVSRWMAYLAIASTLIPLICLFIYRKEQPRQNRILAVCLYISFVFDVSGLVTARIYHTSVVSNNLYCIAVFPAIMWFYHETLINKWLKIVTLIFTFTFLVLASTFAAEQGLTVINHNTITISSILITLTSLFFVVDFNRMDHSSFAKNRFHQTNILINTSLALYYLIAIAVFTVTDKSFSNLTEEDIYLLWSFHNGAQVIKNIGIAAAFYLTAKHSHTPGDVQRSQKQTHQSVKN